MSTTQAQSRRDRQGRAPGDGARAARVEGSWEYWLDLPLRWGHQMGHNLEGILRVLDLTRVRPLPAGLVGMDHPWVTGLNPATGKSIWPQNVIYRTPHPGGFFFPDEVILEANGRFLATRVRQSAVVPELPIGRKRRMPHAINYIHGSSHYNSGIVLFTDFAEGFRHVTDPAFRHELHRFVRMENREVLFLFRQRDYDPREYADFSCCVRTVFPWFCNPNGPRGRVLWGNSGPFAAANLITGAWIRDVYALKRPGGARTVIRPAIAPGRYFRGGPYGGGRGEATWPEKLLSWATYWRVRLRGARGGMFFVDRRSVYADQIENRIVRGLPDEPVTPL